MAILKFRLNETHSRRFCLLFLVAFALWFCLDLVTFKKAFVHADIASYYFPYHYWFARELTMGHFSLWNPYFGIGQPVEWFLTFPLDIFTFFAMVFGPQYHYFHVVHLILLLFAAFYVFLKMKFSPLLSVFGAILFFMSPWVMYFYFYFLLTPSFIGHVLLFAFSYYWFMTKRYRYLGCIALTMTLSMFGTKAEFWFYNAVLFIFYSSFLAFFIFRENYLRSFKSFLFSAVALGVGILGQLWQVNLLVRLMQYSERGNEASWRNLFSAEMYGNLVGSVTESELWKLMFLGGLFYCGFKPKNTRLNFFCLLGGVVGLYFFRPWAWPIFNVFIRSPFLIGAILGILLGFLFLRRNGTFVKSQCRAAALFLLFVFYWCRPESGNLAELDVIRTMPLVLSIVLSTLVWLGCAQLPKSNLARTAWAMVLFVFLARDQGQILMTYLVGQAWLPTRDNYLIEFAQALLAVVGLAALEQGRMLHPWASRISWPWVLLVAILLGSATNLYYCHWVVMDAPPDFPYYQDVPRIRQLVKELKDHDHSRVFIINKPTQSMTFGFGGSLLENVGQVSLYSSLVPKNYKDWTFFQRTGWIPQKGWGGWNSAYGEKTIRRLPRRQNPPEIDNVNLYYYTIMAKPPVDQNSLRFLGVKYVLFLNASMEEPGVDWFDLRDTKSFDAVQKKLDLADIRTINDGLFYNQKSSGHLNKSSLYGRETIFLGRIKQPLFRSFVVQDVTPESLGEFMYETKPVVSGANDFIKTSTRQFAIQPAKIKDYQQERVSIEVQTAKNGYLVLSDLFHPYWHARIDGKETPVLPAFSIFRAVSLPPGRHYVEFYCRIPFFWGSIFISCFAVLGSLWLSFLGFWQERLEIAKRNVRSMPSILKRGIKHVWKL